jgi:serine phosphatase RsbU (regulator of sigma subunit)
VVPVLDRYDRLGILALGAPAGVTELSPLDQALAADLGRRAGAALRNARAYDHERQVATTLQRSLMPRLSDVAGLDTCGAYEPVAVGTEVGGDWYDVLALTDGSVAVTIGDVTGHSMEAAAAMGRLSGAIRCYSYDGLGPADVLRHLDRLHDHLLDGLLVTCTCLRLRPRPDGWAVTISNAGHLPPILVAPGTDGPAVTVELGRGPMIGPYANPTREDGDVHLPWGALLVLCTDGLIERRTETIDQSIERLRTSAEAIDRTAPLDDVCAKLSAGLRPEGEDDVAVLCLRATPSPTP